MKLDDVENLASGIISLLLVAFFFLLPWARSSAGTHTAYVLTHSLAQQFHTFWSNIFVLGLFYLIPILSVGKVLYDYFINPIRITGIVVGMYTILAMLFYFSIEDGAQFANMTTGAYFTIVTAVALIIVSALDY